MIIILMFLGLGFSSIAKIKSTKLDPKVYYTAKLIDNGTSLISDSEDLYNFIIKSTGMNPNKVIIIEDKSGNKIELTQQELIYEKITNLLKKIKSEKQLMKKIKSNDELDNLYKATEYYYQAFEIINETCEDILYNLDEIDCSIVLIPNKNEYLEALGKNANNIKMLIQKARKSLHN